jgi:pimeloyl-ACP methyl ester carboxylesterase
MDRARTLIASDGTRLAYWLWSAGVPGSRHLLLLHGAASNHTRWSELVETTRLRERWDLLRPDLRGNGASMTREGQEIGVWCDDLVEILDAEGWHDAVVAGHSLGAQIAIQLAHRAPRRVSALVLVDPVFPRSLSGRSRLVSRCRLLVRCAAWVVRLLNRLGLRRSGIPDRDLRELDEETRRALRGSDSFELIARRYGALGLILKHMPTANYLRQLLATLAPLPPLAGIRCPALVLLSGGSTLADLEVVRDEIAAFPTATVVILPANHWPLTETPDEVREAIEEWVEVTLPEAEAGPGPAG